MAVIGWSEVSDDRQGMRGQVGRLMARRHFIAETNSPHTEQLAVLSYAECPQPYQPYQTDVAFDPRMVVRALTATPRDNTRLLWDVWVDYDSEYERRDNPFTEPPDIEYDSELFDEPMPGRAAPQYDISSQSGNSGADPLIEVNARGWQAALSNSAGEVFDPPVTRKSVTPLVRYTRNEPNFTAQYKLFFENTVNNAVWSGLQARQAWLRSIRAQSHVQKSTNVVTPDIFYFRVEYTFALKGETWDIQKLDNGSYYLDYVGLTGYKKAFRDTNGNPYFGLLDHSDPDEPGKKLADGEDPQYIIFPGYRETTFDLLGINLNLALDQRLNRPRAGR